ncbi:MAG: SH3 domain-containing protein [Dehalococcoidia bacterium]
MIGTRKALVAAAVALVAAAFAACGGDDAPSPTVPTATSTPPAATPSGTASTATASTASPSAAVTRTPSPPPGDVTACPDVGQVCDYAFALADAFNKQDWPAAAKLFEGVTFTCPDPPPPAQGIPTVEQLACEGKAKGTKVQVVIYGRFASEASVIFVEQLAASFARQYGIAGPFTLRAIGVPFRQECENCRRIVLSSAARDLAVMAQITLAGPKWTGTRLYDGSAQFLLGDLERVGSRITTYDPAARKWSNFETVKSTRKEYDGVVAAGGDCLNVRETSSTRAKVVTCLPDGSALLVIEYTPPVVQDGVTWVQIQANKPDGTKWAGWAAAEFVKPK